MSLSLSLSMCQRLPCLDLARGQRLSLMRAHVVGYRTRECLSPLQSDHSIYQQIFVPGNKTQHPVTSLKPRVLVLRTTSRESHQEARDKERNRDRRTNTNTDTTDRRRTHEHNKTHRKRTLPNPPSTRSAKSEQHGPIIVVNYSERPSPPRRRWGLCGKGGFRMDRQSPRGGVPDEDQRASQGHQAPTQTFNDQTPSWSAVSFLRLAVL